jgi:uncharacterized protein YqgQ
MSKDGAAAAANDTPTEDELANAKPGLSDEEKAALAAEDDQAGDGEGKGDKAKDADDPPQDADAAESTDDDAAAGPSKEIPRGSAANLDLQPSRPVDLKAIGTRMNDLDVLQSELDKKYDDEDMDAKEYLAQSRLITQETSNLTADVREAQFTANANKSFAATDWQRSVNDFVAENDEFQTTIMQGALNAALNELYADDKNVGSSHNWYLQTAANAVRDQISPSEAAEDNPSDKDPNAVAVAAAKAAAKSASDAKGKLPKTLSDVPVADDASTSKDKFADIDSLEGVELEAALANMTTEQEQEYLRAE